MTLPPDSAAAPLRPGAATLTVRDLRTVARFYEQVIGLDRIGDDSGAALLGTHGTPLLELRQRRTAEPDRPGFAGLFHTAFLMPSRADLGRWLAGAMAAGVRFDGASDHAVSEALYLSDPEGNGIEVYADRPRTAWQTQGGMVRMVTEPLDVRGLVGAGDGGPPDRPQPAGIGHIHLRVGGLPEAESFYAGVLGLPVTCRYPGAVFHGAAGYHHHVAVNTWHSRGAPRRTGRETGLSAFDLRADAATFDATAARMEAAGGRAEGDTVVADDPFGNRIILRRA
jgi:catechol 2,3-dioxygenase